MIPLFPEFKKLELSDREEILNITKDFPPYSDFDYTSMWSWNIENTMEISVLNNNLVLKFSGYIDGKPFYTFLGNTNTTQTASQLIKLSKSQNIIPILKLIPEISIENIDLSIFEVSEDRDNYDYIVSTKKISDYSGSEFAKKRNYTKRYNKDNPYFGIQKLDISNIDTQKQILAIFNEWVEFKELSLEEAEHEIKALKRCLNLPKERFTTIGISDTKKLIAFWILEIVNENYAISHFEKASSKNFTGINQFLRQQGSQLLLDMGVSFINLEQDLGIEGLRISKESYIPTNYLKKYNVQLK